MRKSLSIDRPAAHETIETHAVRHDDPAVLRAAGNRTRRATEESAAMFSNTEARLLLPAKGHRLDTLTVADPTFDPRHATL